MTDTDVLRIIDVLADARRSLDQRRDIDPDPQGDLSAASVQLHAAGQALYATLAHLHAHTDRGSPRPPANPARSTLYAHFPGSEQPE
jgi:hypothetical protein